MSAIASLAVRLAGRGAARRFAAACARPEEAQKRKLLEITRRNADTEIGRRLGFDVIASMEEWRQQVPVHRYEDLAPSIRRVREEGASGVLTREDPVMFARTSGTSGEPKFIPVTPTCQGRDHADQMRTWLWHAQRDHPGIFRGRVVSLVSPAVEGHTKSGIPYGSTSGVIYRRIPALVKRTYAVPYEVFEVPDYNTKYYLLLRFGLPERVTFLSTANPSSIVKLCELADRWSEDLIRDVHDGSLRADLDLSAEQRLRLERALHPAPARATELARLRATAEGRLRPGDYWPHLELIGCWKGGTVGAHVERFPRWFTRADGSLPAVRDWGYLSSEARGSIPLSDEGAGGVLTVATNVYEFVPREEVEAEDDAESWTFLGAHEIEEGADYYIFITTTGGLYRYDINDVIRVVGRWRRTPVIEFLRKGRGMVSLTGEKVSVDQVIAAFEAARKETGLGVSHFKAQADREASRYDFLVEGVSTEDPQALRRLLHALDRHLRRLNLEYDGKRASLRLADPSLKIMQVGWYEEKKRAQSTRGKRTFQAKTELLSMVRGEEDPKVRAVVLWKEGGEA